MTIATKVRAQSTIRRSYPSAIDEVWEFWTTIAGIEAWWGPEGFEVRVGSLDLRPGGTLGYVTTAIGEEHVSLTWRAGMPLSTECRITYNEVLHERRLAYTTIVDFIPGVEDHDIATVVEFEESGGITDVVVTSDAMPDEHWTQRTCAGSVSQLRKLDALVELMTAGDRL